MLNDAQMQKIAGRSDVPGKVMSTEDAFEIVLALARKCAGRQPTNPLVALALDIAEDFLVNNMWGLGEVV